MIINAPTIFVTLLIITVGGYVGLQFIRKFALQIAQENHDAMLAMDQADEEKRLKKEKLADQAAASAFAQVEPLLTQTKSSSPSDDNNNNNTATQS